MQSKYRVVVGSIVGAVAVHAAMVACGTKGKSDTHGSDGGFLDAMKDAIADILGEETRDAVAAGDAGSSGCGCTESTPASENSAQLKMGNIGSVGLAGAIVVTGPFVLTDPTSDGSGGNGVSLVIEAPAATCTPLATNGPASSLAGYFTTISAPTGSAHGSRYLVPAGQMLCAYPSNISVGNTGSFQWAGFTPYQ